MSSSFLCSTRMVAAFVCLFVSSFSFAASDPITIDGTYDGNPDNHPDSLWISHSPVTARNDVITRLNSTTGDPRFDISLTGSVQSFAIDGQTGNLWVYTDKGLQGYTPKGELLLPAPVLLPENGHGRGHGGWFKGGQGKAPNLTPEQIRQFRQRSDHPAFKLNAKTGNTKNDAAFWWWWTTAVTAMAVDGKNGVIWLAQGDTLHRVSLGGAYLGKTGLTRHVRHLALDIGSGQLWAATRNRVYALDPAGKITTTIELQRRHKIRDIAYAPVTGQLLLLTRRSIRHYAANGQLLAQSDNVLRPAARHISPDGQGGLWQANIHEVAFQTKAQVLSRNIAFSVRPFAGIWPPAGPIMFLQSDPGDHSAWVTGFFAAQQIHTDASRGFGYQPQSGFWPEHINSVALYADITPPAIFIASPLADSFTNDNTPDIKLSYIDIGSAVDPESINLTVDDKAITATCLPEPLSAVCTPVTPLLDGYLHLIATVAEFAFNESVPADVWFTVDTVPPKIIVNDTTNNGFTNQPELTLTGRVDEKNLAGVSINGQSVDTDVDKHFAYAVTLTEGANIFVIRATDLAGNHSEITHTVILDSVPPVMPVVDLVTISQPDENGQITITGTDGSVEAGAWVQITNTRTGETITVMANDQGAFSAQLTATSTDTLALQVRDAATNTSGSVTLPVNNNGNLPPDPTDIAPPLSTTGITPFDQAIAFLYAGDNPIQRGVEPETIKDHRVAVLRGQVRTRSGVSLSGVKITILHHPELGYTLTRTDGMFDMAVNGGGQLTINYRKEGYLPVQRTLQTDWNQWYWADDVVMIPLSDKVTTIDLTDNTQAYQVARGEIIHGVDGTRQATLLFPAGLTATMTTTSGEQIQISQLDIRATEYTVGDTGSQAMPGKLPPASAYTYAVELSVDQVLENGIKVSGKGVVFNKPVSFYVDNFLNFPIGGAVPTGYYNSDTAAWIPYQNGRIVEILSIQDGKAVLDVTGTGEPATTEELNELGITDSELAQLAQLYQPGESLWRVRLTHLSTWDCNWPWGPPEDAEAPDVPLPKEQQSEDSEEENECPGCTISPQTQSVGESIKIAGTDFSLHYKSNRTNGYHGNRLSIPVTGSNIPTRLMSIELEVRIAGKRIVKNYTPAPNITETIIWDGRDGFGRKVYGSAEADITLTYRYPCAYRPGYNGFGQFSGTTEVIGTRSKCTGFLMSRSSNSVIVSPYKRSPTIVGNWSLSIYHALQTKTGILQYGDGKRQKLDNDTVITTVAYLGYPSDVSLIPSGGLYVAGDGSHQVLRVNPDGAITTVAGTGWSGPFGQGGFSGDGGLAFKALLNFPVAVATEPNGGFYIADNGNNRIRYVNPEGIITTVAGTGSAGFSGDGGLAVNAQLNGPWDIALDMAGNLYFADSENNRIRRISPNGIITTIAGTGEAGFSGDGGFAIDAKLDFPTGLAVSNDGSIYIASYKNNRIRRISPDGIITTVAGTGNLEFNGDGGLAINANLFHPFDVSVDNVGNLFIADTYNYRIRKVNIDGIITTIAGNGEFGYSGDGGSPVKARTTGAIGIALAPNRNFYLAGSAIRKVSLTYSPSDANIIHVASQSGELVYIFDAEGRHLKTKNAYTGEVIYHFLHNEEGKLSKIIEFYGAVTTIKRDSSGYAVAIIAPDGQRTDVTVDNVGYLAGVTKPNEESWLMTYTNDGLLTSFTDPLGSIDHFSYNEQGRLVENVNSIGGGWQLNKTELPNGYRVEMITGEGRISRFSRQTSTIGTRVYTDKAPDGTITKRSYSNHGNIRITYPDGTMAFSVKTPDPRFGMKAPFVSEKKVVLPSGLEWLQQTNRTIDLADENDLLSLITLNNEISTNGHVATVDYTASDRKWIYTSPEGRIVTKITDKTGRPIKQTITGLNAVSYSYDARGRLTNTSSGDGNSRRSNKYSYYSEGMQKGYLASITDAMGRNVRFEYDRVGRMVGQTLPDGRDIKYQYDANGNLTLLTLPSQQRHSFTYTAANQAASYIPPDVLPANETTIYIYNLDKQILKIIHPDGRAVDYSYNTGGKLATLTIPRGQYQLSYDSESGQLTSIMAPDGGRVNFAYNGFLVTNTSWTNGPVTGQVSVDYDSNFRLTGLSVNDQAINLTYDDDGLLVQAGDLNLSRHATTGLQIITSLRGLSTTLDYNGFGELQFKTTKTATKTFVEVVYTRDKLGRITNKTETLLGEAYNYSYEYDLAGRLIEVKRDGQSSAVYTYDANSNRLSANYNGVLYTATYDQQDRLLTYGNTNYYYTDNGELRKKVEASSVTTYDYDLLGNLVHVSLPGNIEIDYLIDGRNRRIGKKVNGVLKRGLLYWDQLNPVAELDANGNVVSRFVYGAMPNVPAYLVKGGITYRIISDDLGSVRLVVNVNTGEVAQRIDYSPFGKVILDTNPGFQPFGFAGGLYDHHTGLVRFGARDYDAQVGRWTAKDPILFAGGQANLYGYVVNDPINLSDSKGTGPLLFAACTVVNAVYNAYSLHSTFKAYDAVKPLQEQLNRVNNEIAQCSAKNTRRWVGLHRIRRDLIGDISNVTQRITRPQLDYGLGDVSSAAIAEGGCLLLLFAPTW